MILPKNRVIELAWKVGLADQQLRVENTEIEAELVRVNTKLAAEVGKDRRVQTFVIVIRNDDNGTAFASLRVTKMNFPARAGGCAHANSNDHPLCLRDPQELAESRHARKGICHELCGLGDLFRTDPEFRNRNGLIKSPGHSERKRLGFYAQMGLQVHIPELLRRRAEALEGVNSQFFAYDHVPDEYALNFVVKTLGGPPLSLLKEQYADGVAVHDVLLLHDHVREATRITLYVKVSGCYSHNRDSARAPVIYTSEDIPHLAEFQSHFWKCSLTSSSSLCARPKHRIDPELVHLVDQHHEIVAEHLRQRLIDLGRLGLAAERVAKLSLDHAERALDVRPLVVVGDEFLAAIEEVTEHLAPCATAPRPTVPALPGVRALERDERRPAVASNRVGVDDCSVPLIGRDFSDGEGLGRGVDQRGKLRAIVRVGTVNLNGRDHVGLDAAHDVRLDPRVLTTGRTVLVIKPRFKTAGREPGGIDCEVNLDRLERTAALRNQREKDGREIWIFECVQYRVMARQFADVPALVSLAQIAHAAARGGCRIDLHHSGEHGIPDRKARSAALLIRLGEARAQIAQQHHEAVFLMRLRRVVGGPVLGIGPLDGLGDADGLGFGDCLTVEREFALDHDADGEDVLARLAARLKVGAGAARRISVQPRHGIAAHTALRRHRPARVTPNHLEPRRDFQTPLLSSVHDQPPCWYLLLVDTIGVDLSIPFVYTLGRWYGDRRPRTTSWGWSCCGARGAAAGTSGSRARARRTGRSSGRPSARSANPPGGTSPSGRRKYTFDRAWGG